MNSPYWYQIATASLVVLACCVASAFCFWYAVRQRNWLFHIVAVGTAVVVAGIVGERNVVQGTRRPGSVWDLSIKVPGLPLNVDQVTVAGLIIALLGLSLVLFLERVVPVEQRWRPPPARPLDEEDSV
ncbi:MAG: hypothetical protein WCB85_01935 [Candidatus Dormiibacterota bacterium]